ncbi:peptide/nickel transport system permease protein [Fervidobacterium changbaicum]|uniref:ABC transporter permease n=1 Tax=Fervidobacterium changbaicum TaxID=310769 RepID=UPI00087FDF87|nr:ABC transporter permease [Fervidobacterium changbaicum]SDG97110.1 peptide/nickel transport system permease protein [Fervidobacterium changbaicum]
MRGLKYVANRLFFFVITLFFALTINFVLPRLMPGDPAERILSRFGPNVDEKAIEAMRIALGVEKDKNLLSQFVDYLKNTITGNFGISYLHYPVPVSQVLRNSIPWTLGLVGTSTILSFLLGTFLGIYAGWNRDKLSGSALLVFSLSLRAIPYFWLAMIILYIFGYKLGWFPLSNAYSTTEILTGFSLVLSVIYHAILPSITLIVASLGSWILTMRNNMVSVLSEDFITLAEAKGLDERYIMVHYAARNAILPSITAFGISLGFVVSGALLTEIVYSYPGVGYQLYRAVLSQDFPLIQAIFFFISLSVLLANLIMDFVYAFLDPRVRG